MVQSKAKVFIFSGRKINIETAQGHFMCEGCLSISTEDIGNTSYVVVRSMPHMQGYSGFDAMSASYHSVGPHANSDTL